MIIKLQYNSFYFGTEMFDSKKALELQNRSHVRGKLNKQFFSSQQEELEKKRREMKYILDQQVQERRRQKQKQKYQYEMKMKKEDDQIRAYYANLQDRDRKIVQHNSRVYNNPSNSYGDQPVMSLAPSTRSPNGVYSSKVSLTDKAQIHGGNPHQLHHKNKSNQKKSILDASDIPVMPVMQSSSSPKNIQKSYHNQSHAPYQPITNSNIQNHHRSVGKIPLLEIPQQEQRQSWVKGERKKSKNRKNMQVNFQDDRQSKRKPSLPAEQQFFNSQRQNTELKEVFGDLNQELQYQNRTLKQQLKKNQQAISLLIGAVRSNGKLDKFRVQAQKILHGNQSNQLKQNLIGNESRTKKPLTSSEDKQKDIMLPKLKLRHQSIMQDYILGSAKKANQLKAKTFK